MKRRVIVVSAVGALLLGCLGATSATAVQDTLESEPVATIALREQGAMFTMPADLLFAGHLLEPHGTLVESVTVLNDTSQTLWSSVELMHAGTAATEFHGGLTFGVTPTPAEARTPTVMCPSGAEAAVQIKAGDTATFLLSAHLGDLLGTSGQQEFADLSLVSWSTADLENDPCAHPALTERTNLNDIATVPNGLATTGQNREMWPMLVLVGVLLTGGGFLLCATKRKTS